MSYVDAQRILYGDTATGHRCHIVHDHVIDHIDRVVDRDCTSLANSDVLPINPGQADACTITGTGRVTLQQVANDLYRTGTLGKHFFRIVQAGRIRQAGARVKRTAETGRTRDQDATTINRDTLVKVLVEQNGVAFNQAVIT